MPAADPAPDPAADLECRACRAAGSEPDVVLDLGPVPAGDDFPRPGDPEPDALYPLSMWLCPVCHLAQLRRDDTTAEEPLAVEPQALRDQAAAAVALVRERYGADRNVAEFGSPHGGSWLPLLAEVGWHGTAGSADVVVDTFGLMHDADQAEGIRERAARLGDGGVLLLLFHSLATIVDLGQWSSLRHGHFGYYSTTALVPLLEQAGLSPTTAWTFDLYGGTVLLAATRGGEPDSTVHDLLRREQELGLSDPDRVRSLQRVADDETEALSVALKNGTWYAYGAASRTVSVLHRAGVRSDRLVAVADAAPSKQGRAMPGSRIPIVSPDELVAADPERVWLLLPDLRAEVSRALPELAGRWQTSLPGAVEQ